ncbi:MULTISPECIES: hypothetical protein [unclassified Methanoregula]|uniref:hypothetical protein n=1 Tax=unclassified Methanoregula TaxID=2649730 RepID=UPI0025E570AB|nr:MULTISPECIES: hypothetical protein [unclassified Methanoregula]
MKRMALFRIAGSMLTPKTGRMSACAMAPFHRFFATIRITRCTHEHTTRAA